MAPGGPYVLFNFAGEVRTDALKKFPDLYKFYEDVAPALTIDSRTWWTRRTITGCAIGFDHGKVWMSFMVRGGKLSAFDAAYHPVGEPIALGSLRHGVNHTRTSIRDTASRR